MPSELISVEEALRHLDASIPDSEGCKSNIMELMQWFVIWNKDRTSGNGVFCYRREGRNVGFALDRSNNRTLARKPNFMVIKLAGTDREFKTIHADFNLEKSGYSELSEYLTQRPSNSIRWFAKCADISRMSFADFQQLFLGAYERKGGAR